jgi:ribosomal protein L19
MKKAQISIEAVMFIIIMILFIVSVSSFVVRAGSGSGFIEERYAKKIALALDESEPGMKITLDISELFEKASAQEYTGQIIEIDNVNNNVQVGVVSGSGVQYRFLSTSAVVWNINTENKTLELEIQ